MKYQRGAMTIEAAFVLPLLLFIVFSGIELSRLMLTYSALEHALATSARKVKLSVIAGNYGEQLIANIRNSDPVIVDADKIVLDEFSVYTSPQTVMSETTSTVVGGEFVSYKVSYPFSSLSPWLGTMNLESNVMVKHEN